MTNNSTGARIIHRDGFFHVRDRDPGGHPDRTLEIVEIQIHDGPLKKPRTEWITARALEAELDAGMTISYTLPTLAVTTSELNPDIAAQVSKWVRPVAGRTKPGIATLLRRGDIFMGSELAAKRPILRLRLERKGDADDSPGQ